MKKNALLLVFFAALFAVPLQAQHPADSLINVLNTKKLTISEQLETYRQICYKYIYEDPKVLKQYATHGLELALKTTDNAMKARFTEYIGNSYVYLASYDTAFTYYQKALDFAKEAKHKALEAEIYANMAVAYAGQGKREMELEYYLKALPIHESTGNTENQITTLLNIASIHMNYDRDSRAIQYIEQAKALAEKTNYSDGIIATNNKLGSYYQNIGNFEKAKEHLLKALEVSKTANNKIAELNSYYGLANTYRNGFKDYETAEKYADKALQLATEFNYPPAQSASYASLAYIYLSQKRYNDCLAAATNAWNLDSIDIATGDDILLLIAISNLHLGNEEKANIFFNKHSDFIKQKNEERSQKNLIEMESKYETEKKEMQIASLKKDKKLYIGFGISGIVVLLLLSGFLFARHRLNVNKRKIAEFQVKQLEQEKQLVATQAVLEGETAERSRLARDLHDGLGGMLSVVKLNLKDMKSYSIMDNPDVVRFGNALEMLDQSIGELRRVAHHMMPESLMRYGLKVSLEDFCRAIPGVNFIYLGEDPRLDSRLEVLIYRSAYELINNALKHSQATNINVQLMIDNGLVSLTVSDNGIGFDPKTAILGNGLENIRTRLALYNGKMNIHSSPGKGSEISVEIEAA